jgi:hypothetical protein
VLPACFGDIARCNKGCNPPYHPGISQGRRVTLIRRTPGRAADQVDFVINLTTAKALGIDISPAVLARADEVIE